jgi:uncharacterized membrane protein YagU involved in acid resistance
MTGAKVRHDVSNRLLTGAFAGLVATVPMTAAMTAMHRRLPAPQRYPLPPRRVTMRAAGKAGVREHLDEPARKAATMVSHFGYGTAVGSLFGAIAPRDPVRGVALGAGFGLLVWTVSYLGLLPALDLHPPATKEPAGRNGLMIGAHLVWGATLGALVGTLRRD